MLILLISLFFPYFLYLLLSILLNLPLSLAFENYDFVFAYAPLSLYYYTYKKTKYRFLLFFTITWGFYVLYTSFWDHFAISSFFPNQFGLIYSVNDIIAILSIAFFMIILVKFKLNHSTYKISTFDFIGTIIIISLIIVTYLFLTEYPNSLKSISFLFLFPFLFKYRSYLRKFSSTFWIDCVYLLSFIMLIISLMLFWTQSEYGGVGIFSQYMEPTAQWSKFIVANTIASILVIITAVGYLKKKIFFGLIGLSGLIYFNLTILGDIVYSPGQGSILALTGILLPFINLIVNRILRDNYINKIKIRLIKIPKKYLF